LKCNLLGILIVSCLVATPASGQAAGYDPFRSGGTTGGAANTGSNLMESGEFVDTPLTDVLRVVSDLTGWTILMSPEISAQPPKVNLWVKNMAPAEVLQQVVELSGLVMRREGAAYHVMTFDEYTRRFGVERKVRQLEHVAADEVVAAVRPFIESSAAAQIIPAPAGNKVLLLIPLPLLTEIERLIDAIDVPFEQDQIEVVRLTHLDAAAVIPELEKFLVPTGGGGAGSLFAVPPSRDAASGVAPTAGEVGKAGESLLIQFMVEPGLNAVVLRGLPADVKRAAELLRELDITPGTSVVSYELQYTDAEEAFETIERLLDPSGRGTSGRRTGSGNSAGEPRYKIAVSAQNNRVVVEGPPEVQSRVAEVIAAVDQPLPPGSGDIRVYRLENATADEVVAVLQDLLEQEDNDPSARTEAQGAEAAGGSLGRIGDTNAPPGREGGAASGDRGGAVTGPPTGPPPPPRGSGPAIEAVLGTNQIPPRVTAAPEINAVVVRAAAAEHDALASVIQSLDRPREQVQLEVTLVTITSADEFRLGVELGGARFGSIGTLGFTTFGIGQADPTTGGVTISPTAPFGLNLSVFNGDDLSMVVNALKSVGDTRISSAPKLLVADNSPGALSQIEEEPFITSSQGDATTLTSFGGFVEAGTTVEVIPHISKDDWLRLDYEIELSSFRARNAQQLAANIPPPRTVNTTSGTVRIPDGYAVALGGLVGKRDEQTIDKVPLLGDIPLLGELFKNRRETGTYSTLYVFIRPVILRDPGFRDLLLLSEDDLRATGTDDGFPTNPMKLLTPSQGPSETLRTERRQP